MNHGNSRNRYFIGGAAIALIVAIIGVIIAGIQVLQAEINSRSQARDSATIVAVLSKSYDVQQTISALNAYAAEMMDSGTSTAVAEQVQFLRETQSAIEKDVIRTETPINPQTVLPSPLVFSEETATPVFPLKNTSKDFVINRYDTTTIVEGSMYITLVDASSEKNQVNTLLYAPGFQPVEFDFKGVGESFTCDFTYRYEVIILNFEDYYSNAVKYKITSLGPSGNMEKVVLPVTDFYIKPKESKTLVTDNLIITVVSSSREGNTATIIVKSPTYNALQKDMKVGERILYSSDSNFEIFMAGFEPYYGNTVRFIVSKYK